MATLAALQRIEHKTRSLCEAQKVKRTILHFRCFRPAVSKMRSNAATVGYFLIEIIFVQMIGHPMATIISNKSCQFLRPNIRFAYVRFATQIFEH